LVKLVVSKALVDSSISRLNLSAELLSISLTGEVHLSVIVVVAALQLCHPQDLLLAFRCESGKVDGKTGDRIALIVNAFLKGSHTQVTVS